MSSDPFELLSGVWATLNAGLAIDVYSYVPQGEGYPYVALAGITSIAGDDKTNDRQEYTIQIHTWDKNVASFQSVMDNMQAIRGLLHKQETNISVTGYKVVLSRIEFEEMLQEGSSGNGGDNYFHGVQRLRIIVEDI